MVRGATRPDPARDPTRQPGRSAGVHTGECERTDGNLAGLAVHIGARVGAAAGPGEVWVSRTVRDLVAGSGVELRPRGAHRLKGVPEPWELFSLIDADVASVPISAPPPRLKLSDRMVLAAAQRAPRLVRVSNRGSPRRLAYRGSVVSRDEERATCSTWPATSNTRCIACSRSAIGGSVERSSTSGWCPPRRLRPWARH